jgi:hypothetical protein
MKSLASFYFQAMLLACSLASILGSGAHLVILPNWCFRA